jgi:hypothetical protein
MKTSVKTLQEAAEVLAGKSRYDTVVYQGIVFRRNGDISVAEAKECILDYLSWIED